MSEIIPIGSKFKAPSNTLEFINSFGAIFSDQIIIPKLNESMPIYFECIKKVELQKQQRGRKNLCSILVAIFLICIAFYSPVTIPYNFKVAVEAIAGLLFIYGIFYREYTYKFLVVKNYDFEDYSEVIIDKTLKEDAKRIMFKVNKKIKTLRVA